MVDFSNLINLQIEIFILIFIGYLLTKKGIITKASRQTITDLVIDVILPANIINSYMIEFNMDILRSCAVVFIASIVIQYSYTIFNRFLYPFAKKEQLNVLKYATLCSNAGFLGNPLVEGIYGPTGLLYASVFLIPQRIVMWTAGVSCFTETTNLKDVVKRVITHPCIVATMIGLCIMIFQIPVPMFATKTIKAISGCTTVMSILVIGSILSDFPLREVLNKVSAYYTAIRLIALPALCAIVCILLKLPTLVTAVCSVLVGMPAGTTTAILAEKYGCDSKLAVQLVFLSTLLSLITIPCMVMIIETLL